jgi:hypothetical protein
MATLLLKFGVLLENYNIEEFDRHKGPLFHRWLPDGEKDAILVDVPDPTAELKVWFERRGFVDDRWIRFDYSRPEIDPEIMERQAILDAGPLRGY